MRILMLGNSYTFKNNMPETLAQLLDAGIVQHTRGGAGLAEQLNPATALGGLTLEALTTEKWDYVILQEKSNGPVKYKKAFLRNVKNLCEAIRENGAVPVLFETWAYKAGSEAVDKTGLSYDEMYFSIKDAYSEAAESNNALIAKVGEAFYEKSAECELYAEDCSHPNKEGSFIAASIIADTILQNEAVKAAGVDVRDNKTPAAFSDTEESDAKLRLLYLYQLLLKKTDDEHTLSTKEIQDYMKAEHGIYMHRTTVPMDIALLKNAGIEIMSVRRRAWHYYLGDRRFSLPELKILVDAVQSSRFITEKKSLELIRKLYTLTSDTNAEKLKRSLNITGRVKSDNEKGYYIVDAINEAINTGKKISFFYFEFDGKKRQVLKNDGLPYTVSPYDLFWDGDYYYLIGYCDERMAVRTFRVDRIFKQPVLLDASSVVKPKDYSVSKYTTSVFRMYASEKETEVTLECENSEMKYIVDKFGMGINTSSHGNNRFRVKVSVCTSPTFYRWVFGSCGKIVIKAPQKVADEYRKMLTEALESQK